MIREYLSRFVKPSDRALVIEFWNVTPHLEISLEVASYLSDFIDYVEYKHWGRYVSYNECYRASTGKLCREDKLATLASSHIIKIDSTYHHSQDEDIDFEYYLKSSSHLLRLSYYGYPVGSLVYANLCDIFKTPIPDIEEHLDLIIKLVKLFISVFHSSVKALKESNATVCVVFNGRFICPAAVAAAATFLGIKVLYHERGGTSERLYLTTEPVHCLSTFQAELIETWNRKLIDDKTGLEEGRKILCDRINGMNHDGPSFQSSFKTGFDADPDELVISYFSSSEDEINSIPDPLAFPRSPWKSQFSALRSLFKVIQEHPKVRLYIRLHPNLSNKSVEEKMQWEELILPANCTLIAADSPISSYDIARKSLAVFTYSSTIGAEAVGMGKPVVCLGPSLYDYLPSVICPSSERSLSSLVKSMFSGKIKVNVADSFEFFYSYTNYGILMRFYRSSGFNDGCFMGASLS